MDKNKLRQQIYKCLNNISINQKKEWSNNIFQQIINDSIISNSQVIGIYYSINDEVDTKLLIEYLLKNNKKVCLPRVNDEVINFYQITSYDFAYEKYWKIKQPLINSVFCQMETIDVLIMPGLAFDSFNYRLGRGKGHYDKFLTNFKKPTIMLAFNCQKIKKIPHQIWDIPVKFVYTEVKKYE